MSASDPGVLIESGNGRSRRSENHPDPKSANNFRLGKMGEDFDDRPFVRSRTFAQFGQGDSLDQTLKLLWCGGLHFEGLLAFDVARDALDVLLRCFFHVVSTISLICPAGILPAS